MNVTASSELVWTLGGFSCCDWVSCTCDSVRAKLRITNLEHIPTDDLLPLLSKKDWEQPGSADMPQLLLFPKKKGPDENSHIELTHRTHA